MEFAFFRAGRGKPASGTGPDSLDLKWSTYVAESKTAGIRRGGYWRFFPSADLTWQVTAFCDRLLAQPIELPPLVDIEDAEGIGQAALTDWAVRVLSGVEKQTNRIPLLYTNKNFLSVNLDRVRLARWPLALARWTEDPSWPDDRAVFWQYAGSTADPRTKVNWASGPVDRQRTR